MPEYLSPGVYVEEVSSGTRPIEGVGTSTGAFVGGAVQGPVNDPDLITNFTQFAATFGGFHQDHLLAYAVRSFFLEGGTRCYVVRAFRPTNDGDLDADTAQEILQTGGNAPADALRVLAANPGTWGNQISVEVGTPAFDPDDPTNQDGKFGLTVLYQASPGATPDVVETYDRLSLREFTADGRPNPFHAEIEVNRTSRYIRVQDLSADPMVTTPPAAGSSSLGGGEDGQPLTTAELIGTEAAADGLHAFDRVDDINIVAIPDLMAHGITNAEARTATTGAFAYCEGRKDCFFVADPPSGLTPQQVLAYKQARAPFTGGAFNSTFGALYYPWVFVSDPLGGLKLVPPSGLVAGAYSGTDVRRGVDDGHLRSAAGIERILTDGEQDTLNPQGIDVIRSFAEAGIVIWGARTVSADPEWRYVPVRRLFLFLEESIFKGTQWVVFEPNDTVLWRRIIKNVSAFLRIQWLDGKLVGEKAEEAFFVKCDEETNPPESVEAGRVVTLIGVAPQRPAEFVIFRISQTRPGAGPG